MESERVLNRFLSRYLRDAEAGRAASVETYQALWPQHAEAIAAEFSRLEGALPSDRKYEVRVRCDEKVQTRVIRTEAADQLITVHLDDAGR